jgi:hypothetical protein
MEQRAQIEAGAADDADRQPPDARAASTSTRASAAQRAALQRSLADRKP